MSMTGNMELAVNNPFRYRGYYYDEEIGLYYLNSRYYDLQTGRFVNAEPNVDYGKFDEGAGLNGYNVFAYCANNPVMFKDDSGEFVISISIGIGSLLTWAAYGIATAVGVGAGVAIGTAVGNNIRRSTTYVDTRSDSKAKEKDRYKKYIPPSVYYHVTDAVTANKIIFERKIYGSRNEAYHVFAWKFKPDKKAIKLSGARNRNAIIRFSTYAAFEIDWGVTAYCSKFCPVKSVFRGPITIISACII